MQGRFFFFLFDTERIHRKCCVRITGGFLSFSQHSLLANLNAECLEISQTYLQSSEMLHYSQASHNGETVTSQSSKNKQNKLQQPTRQARIRHPQKTGISDCILSRQSLTATPVQTSTALGQCPASAHYRDAFHSVLRPFST